MCIYVKKKLELFWPINLNENTISFILCMRPISSNLQPVTVSCYLSSTTSYRRPPTIVGKSHVISLTLLRFHQLMLLIITSLRKLATFRQHMLIVSRTPLLPVMIVVTKYCRYSSRSRLEVTVAKMIFTFGEDEYKVSCFSSIILVSFK